MKRPGWMVLVVVAVLAGGTPPAAAQIYRWTDEQGVERFSDRIEDVPERFRRDVTRELRHDPPAPEAAPAEEAMTPVEPPAAAPPAAPAEPPTEMPQPEPPGWAARVLGQGAVGVAVAAVVAIGLWLLFSAGALWFACRLVTSAAPSFARALGVAALQMVAGLAIGSLLAGAALVGVLNPGSLVFRGLQLVVGLLVNVLVIQALLALGLRRALAVAVVEVVIVVALTLVVGLGIGTLATLFGPEVAG